MIIRNTFGRISQVGYLRCTNRHFSEVAPDGKGDRLHNILVQAVNSRPRPRPKLSSEEAAKNAEIGRKYVIGKFHAHNVIHHDLACKMRLKEHAIRMMPRISDGMGYLKEKALQIDVSEESMPPLYRSVPLDTPEIEDFDPSDFIEKE